MMKIILVPLMCLVGVSLQHQCEQDHSYSCEDYQTCCRLPEGQGIGCCPYRNAVCCSDRLHCCPQGLQCDVKEGRCVGGKINMLLQTIGTPATLPDVTEQRKPKVQLNKTQRKVPMFIRGQTFFSRKSCPDKDFSCESNQTCCPLVKGWGCCPLGPHSVCCKDGQHCCPVGSICDEKEGDCILRP